MKTLACPFNQGCKWEYGLSLTPWGLVHGAGHIARGSVCCIGRVRSRGANELGCACTGLCDDGASWCEETARRKRVSKEAWLLECMKTVMRRMGAAGLQSRKRAIAGLRMRKDSIILELAGASAGGERKPLACT